MTTRKRIAVLATPSDESGQPSPGVLDGDALRERLEQPDIGFEVRQLDSGADLAEQLDVLFEDQPPDDETSILFYASGLAEMSSDGEFFLCLDPQQPETGDALRDIVGVFEDLAPGPVLFLLECRHSDTGDPFRSAQFVQGAKEAVNSTETGVELLVAARPWTGRGEERPSPFTRAAIEEMDGADPELGLTAELLYEHIHDDVDLVAEIRSLTHTPGRAAFELVLGAEPARTLQDDSGDEVHDTRPDDVPPAATETWAEPAPEIEVREESPEPEPVAERDEEADDEDPNEPAIPSTRDSVPPTALPLDRSFQRAHESAPPRVIISSHPPARDASPARGAARSSASSSSRPPPSSAGGPISLIPPSDSDEPKTVAEYMATAKELAGEGDDDLALIEYKKALGLGSALLHERAEIYIEVGHIKRRQGRNREAIANLEKGLQLAPADASEVLGTLVALNVEEGDFRALAEVEERVVARIEDPDERFDRLLEFGTRWLTVAGDDARALASFEQAHELRPDHLGVLKHLKDLYERKDMPEEAASLRRAIADRTEDPRRRAELYYEIAEDVPEGDEDEAIELYELALDSDTTFLEPLAAIAEILAERQEWSELEAAYRRMLERADGIGHEVMRTEVTWELCRRLGMLFRDHLEDPALALDAFEDASSEKPDDRATRLASAGLALEIGEPARAVPHLQAAAALAEDDTDEAAVFHQLFSVFQKLRRPDEAYCAAAVTTFLGESDERERIVFEEHRPEGVPKFARTARVAVLELIRDQARNRDVERVLEVIAPAAIAARLEVLAEAKSLPDLSGKQQQDPETSTIGLVRSFGWAAHFLGMETPRIFVDDADTSLIAVPHEEPTTLAGRAVLRGRSATEMAFLVGRHLSYHIGPHRLLMFYPSLEELSAAFIAAVRIVLPDVPIPPRVQSAAGLLRPQLEARLSDDEFDQLEHAVHAFDESQTRADLGAWAVSVERCATRMGYVLCADLEVAANVLDEDPRGVLAVDDKVTDLMAFAVSDEHHTLRKELGIAIPP